MITKTVGHDSCELDYALYYQCLTGKEMKYLDIPALAAINAQFETIDVGDSFIHGRIEAFSCKTVGSDKKLYKSIENELVKSPHNKSPISNSKSPGASLNTSGSIEHLSVSPFGPLSQPSSRKTMVYLIATLNASYIDYDFSDVSPEQFRKEPNFHMVVNSINTTLSSIINGAMCAVGCQLIGTWQCEDHNKSLTIHNRHTIDMEVDTPKCDIYSYIPDLTSDPFTEEGTIWSFNYFFYNRMLKRIIFFTCRATSKSGSTDRTIVSASADGDDEGGTNSLRIPPVSDLSKSETICPTKVGTSSQKGIWYKIFRLYLGV